MIDSIDIRFSLIFVLLWMPFNYSISQSSSNTYTSGDISTNYDSYSSSCNGPGTTLSIELQDEGEYTVTGIDIIYDFEAISPGTQLEQRSQIHFVNNNTNNTIENGPNNNTPGVVTYKLLNNNLANGFYTAPDTLNFEMRAWRVNTKGSSPYCNTLYNRINNNSWEIIVYYTFVPPPNIYTGGNDDGYAFTEVFDVNPLVDIYNGSNGDGYDFTEVLDVNPLVNIYNGSNNDGYSIDKTMAVNPLDNIYSGANDDGYDSKIVKFINPNCIDNIQYWNGVINTNWFDVNNWDCQVLPDINSHVILDYGLPNYPVLNGNFEIKKLSLNPSSTIEINSSHTFILNGND